MVGQLSVIREREIRHDDADARHDPSGRGPDLRLIPERSLIGRYQLAVGQLPQARDGFVDGMVECELWSHHHPSPRSACGHGSRRTDRLQDGTSASHVCRSHRVSRRPTHLLRRWTAPCCRARDGGPRRAGPVADGAADADCAGRASYSQGRRGRGASSRTGRAGTLRLGAAGDGRGAAGSGRSRWRDPSTAAAHPAGRSGGLSRQRSPPRTTTPSHRRVEQGPDCRPASSQRGTSPYTWDGPSTSSL